MIIHSLTNISKTVLFQFWSIWLVHTFHIWTLLFNCYKCFILTFSFDIGIFYFTSAKIFWAVYTQDLNSALACTIACVEVFETKSNVILKYNWDVDIYEVQIFIKEKTLSYITNIGEGSHKAYLRNLKRWNSSRTTKVAVAMKSAKKNVTWYR